MCTNSIGSSIVTMCLLIVSFMWSIIAASVVDLPEPVVPGEQHDPALLLGEFANDRRQGELLDRADRCGIARQAIEISPRWRNALIAEARDALDFEGEVDLVLLRELAELGLVASSARSAPSVSSALSALTPSSSRQLAIDAKQRRRADLQMQIGAAFSTSSRSAALTSNMPG